ncbi:MAG TPA: hypothetical protein VM370_07500 [Candidatus Thermoplasmatota archaeon]|nr:hypothetical protein [Candidatus Thermoplasmatota archaeon]
MPMLRCRSLLLAALLLAIPAAGAVSIERATGIGPGTHLLIDMDGQTFGCTAGWVFRDATSYYLSTAGHCLIPEGTSATHGAGHDAATDSVVRACIDACTFGGQSGFLLTGTTVALGPVAYARQSAGGVDIGNDFGLVRIPASLVPQLRFSLPGWGIATSARDMRAGETTCYYGAGAAVGETFATMARSGVAIGTGADGSWRMAAPSAVGDSGAAVAICTPGADIAAAGVLTHLAAGTIAGTTLGKGAALATEAGLHVAPVLQ